MGHNNPGQPKAQKSNSRAIRVSFGNDGAHDWCVPLWPCLGLQLDALAEAMPAAINGAQPRDHELWRVGLGGQMYASD